MPTDEKYESDFWKFIWGIRDINNEQKLFPNLDTFNDVAILYNKRIYKYELHVNTNNVFNLDVVDGYKSAKILIKIIRLFESFISSAGIKNNYEDFLFRNLEQDTDRPMLSEFMSFEGGTINDLYIQFKIFVNGFWSIYGEGKLEQRVEIKRKLWLESYPNIKNVKFKISGHRLNLDGDYMILTEYKTKNDNAIYQSSLFYNDDTDVLYDDVLYDIDETNKW